MTGQEVQPQAVPGEVRLDIKRNFFMARVAKHWNGLSREVVESLPLEVLKKPLDMAISVMV